MCVERKTMGNWVEARLGSSMVLRSPSNHTFYDLFFLGVEHTQTADNLSTPFSELWQLHTFLWLKPHQTITSLPINFFLTFPSQSLPGFRGNYLPVSSTGLYIDVSAEFSCDELTFGLIQMYTFFMSWRLFINTGVWIKHGLLIYFPVDDLPSRPLSATGINYRQHRIHSH